MGLGSRPGQAFLIDLWPKESQVHTWERTQLKILIVLSPCELLSGFSHPVSRCGWVGGWGACFLQVLVLWSQEVFPTG